jgi:hypothetical protein
MECLLTEKQLQERCTYWQKVLRLQDWEVFVFVSRERNFLSPKSQGECEWVIGTKHASIRILDPADYPPNESFPQDMERILVHELLHLHFAPFDNSEVGSMEDNAQEQAIESIASGLVLLERKGGSEC